MKLLHNTISKAAATQLIRLSFSRPGILESRAFLSFMEKVFSSTASSYDRIMKRIGPASVLLGPLEGGLAELVHVPEKALDLACGTGSATLLLKDRFRESVVVGADLSEPMIRVLKQKTAETNAASVAALVADSGTLPFRDGSFDLVITQNAPPYLEEMIRVLHPKGTLLLAYSFVFMNSVRPVVARRLQNLQLENFKIMGPAEGMVIIARKSPEKEQ
jgi:ubiquinone/menaquinone biosynthesis C-methylase UbiE